VPFDALCGRMLTCFQTEKEGEPGIDDAAGFFAHVFGGDAFEPYVCLSASTCAY
jgi:hypothetical protein